MEVDRLDPEMEVSLCGGRAQAICHVQLCMSGRDFSTVGYSITKINLVMISGTVRHVPVEKDPLAW